MFRNVLLVLCSIVCWILTGPLATAQVDSTLFAGIEKAYETGRISKDSLLALYFIEAQEAFEVHDFATSRTLLRTYEEVLNDNSAAIYANSIALRAEMAMEEDDRIEAIELLNKALNIYKLKGDSVKYLSTLKQIGINYDYMSDHDMALIYYNDCIDLARKLGRKDVEGACLKNIGGMYSQDGNQDEAIKYFDQSISLAEESQDSALLHRLYHGLGLAYRRFELFTESYRYHQLALQVALDIEDLKSIGFGYQGLGFYFFHRKNYDSAEYYMNQTLSIANKISNDQLKGNAREVLERIYYETGRYKQAYDTYRQMAEEEDSLYTIQNTQLLSAMKAKYLTEKNDRELAEKNLQLQEADSNLIKQRNMQLILLFVLVLLILITILIYRGYVLRKRANDILQSKNAEIQEHLEEIENVNANKSRWFVNVAHELRTPLTLIKGPIQRILKNADLSTSVHSDLQLVERNTKSLSNLVNEILDLSKMEEGEVTVKESVFELKDMVMTVVASFESRAEQLGIQIKSQINTEAHILADKDKLNKVLINLISNALKFTPSGGTVEVILARPKNRTFRIIVKDNGRGIPASDINRVFDRFFQSSRDSQEVTGGTGIGLALSKEIAEMHGGELTVTSTPGMGSSFTLVLPEEIEAARPPFGAEKTSIEDVVESGLIVSSDGIISVDRKPKLLLLEDNEDMATYISSLLTDHFEVKHAKSGIQGLEVLGSYDIKFIISDIMMPEMDGVTFLKKVKSDALWKHLPFIHLTALSDENLKKELLRIGIDDYLMKPFDQEELIIRVHNLYNNYIQRISLDSESKQEVSHDEKMMNILKTEVLTHLEDTNYNVLRLADGAAMSERQLYRYLKSTTGLTPLQFIQEIKLTKANDLARKKVYSSTSELSSAVGFKQPAYFATLFEKRFGKKPAVILKA